MSAAMEFVSCGCSVSSRSTSALSSSPSTTKLSRQPKFPFSHTSQPLRLPLRQAPQRGHRHIRNVGWDPEGILAAPVPGHIARRNYQKKIAGDDVERERLERQLQLEKERRREAREARIIPDTHAGLAEFFLTTEGQEMDFEIARCRPRLTEDFFAYLKSEIGSLRFGANQTPAIEDRVGELEALQKVLREGIVALAEAYDKLAVDLVGAKERLARILTSKDKRATLLEMAGESELDRPLLALLDENIAAASKANEEQAVKFMEKIRGAVVKYITI